MALGRDLTDSFNRLVRGVTKAEPELLDELGIVLRLDPALRAYATAIGKTKEQLNPFERSQAVTNEVLEQAESKFGAISELMPESSFAVQQFGQAFIEVLEDVKVIVADLGAVVLPFFSNNVTALIGALAAFSLGIVKTMLPNFDAVAEQARQKRKALQVELDAVKAEMATLQAGGAIKTKADARGIKKTAAADVQKFRPDLNVKKLTDRQVSSLLAQAKRGRIKMNAQMRGNERAYINSLERMAAANKRIQGKQVLDVQTSEQKKRLEVLKTEQEVINSEEKRANASMNLNKMVGTAFNALMIASVAVMGLDLVKTGVRRMILGKEGVKEYNESMDALETSVSRLEQINEQLEHMEKNSRFAVSNFTQLSNALRSIKLEDDAFSVMNQDLSALTASFSRDAYLSVLSGGFTGPFDKTLFGIGAFFGIDQMLANVFDFTGDAAKGDLLREQREQFLDQISRLKRIATPEMREILQDVQDAVLGGDETKLTASIRKFGELRDEYNRLTAAAAGLNEAQKTLTASIVAFVGKFAPKTVGGNMRTALTASQQAADATREILLKDVEKMGGFELYAMKLGDKDPEAEKIRKRFENLEDVESLNQAIDEILLKHIDKQNAINLATAQNKTLKSSILKDNSALSAQLTRQVNLAEVQNKLDDHQLQMTITRDLLEDDRLAGQQDVIDSLRASLILMEEQEKVLMNQLNIVQTTESIRRSGLQNAIQTSQDTIAPFSIPHMFGMTKPITETQIANTMGENPGFTREDAIQNLQKFNAQLAYTETQMKLINGLSTSIGTALVDGLANAFVEVAKGTMTFADAFKNMTIQILADIAAMTMKMAIFKALAGFFTGPLDTSIFTSFSTVDTSSFTNPLTGLATTPPGGINMGAMNFGATGRSGGIMSSPGYRSYARGGIAMGPDSGYAATLHGTEAVVPLGNSRSIPVELKGEGGGVNNITVNVNGGTEGGGQSPEQAKALGNMIQVATMEIIQREKRPGGVLSK